MLVLLIEHINGDWIIKDESLNYQKKDASTVHFPLTLNAGETKSVYYTYRKEWKYVPDRVMFESY